MDQRADGEQQDAADEVRSPRWRPSQLILVFDGRMRMALPAASVRDDRTSHDGIGRL